MNYCINFRYMLCLAAFLEESRNNNDKTILYDVMRQNGRLEK